MIDRHTTTKGQEVKYTFDRFHTLLKWKHVTEWKQWDCTYGHEANVSLRPIITLAETWVRCCQRKLKRQSNEWQHNDSAWQKKKYRQEQDPLKVMYIVAFDFDGVLVTHSVPAGNRVNGVYYSYFLSVSTAWHILRLHWWFPWVTEGLRWNNCFILITIQKITASRYGG